MSAVNTKTINEITDTLIDYRGKTPPKTTSGVMLITAKVVKNGFIQDNKPEFISEKTYERWMTRGYPKQWDILITTEAPLGQVAQLRSVDKVALAQRIILLRGNPNVVDQNYYFFALQSPLVQGRLEARSSGTTVRGIKQSELRQVEIPVPTLSTQRKIAAVLSAYDDLIENNNRRIAILEEMAQLIYREWFVHFRFPGHEEVEMVEVEGFGRIPTGWEIAKLEQVCDLVIGQSPKSEFYNESGQGLPFHQGVSNFGDRFPTDHRYCTVTKRVAEPKDVLFSVRAPVGRMNIARTQLVVGRGLHAIRSKTGHQSFIYQQLKDKFHEEDMIGGGTIFKSVTKRDVQNIELLFSSSQVLDGFELMVQPIFRILVNLTKKNELLRATRDLLLPRLISGELDVSELDIGFN